MDNNLYKTELNPELFTYELYDSGFWFTLGLSFIESMDIEHLMRAIKEYGIGYCDASRLAIRPMEGSYAIMCEVNGEKIWFHLDIHTFKQILTDNIEN